jgi:HlyD family secretion protein
MRKGFWKILAYLALAAAILGMFAYAFAPTPVTVEARPVLRGNLEVTVEDDGKTRIKEKYIISAPLSGRLARVQLHAGDSVLAGNTILTTLDPTAPTLLDARSRAEAEARLKAAESARQRSEPAVQVAREKVRHHQEEYERAKQLYERTGSTSHEERDRAEHLMRVSNEELRIAEYALQISEYELELARAALVHTQRPEESKDTNADDWRFAIRSPINGRILRVFQESSAVITAGMPLMEVGDPSELEVVIDVLSSDAVKVSPANRVRLEDWGGAHSLEAHVRHVEPSGFTKVSALGIEEQRVNVIIEIDTPAKERPTLGDDFRVEARIVVDEAQNILKVPSGALFRQGDSQGVFVVKDGKAELRPVTVGRRSRLEAEVVAGLTEGEQVVVYPSDKVRDGVWLQLR